MTTPFTATGSEAYIAMFVDLNGTPGEAEWYVDDFTVEAEYMTVKLAERVLTELQSLFQTNLVTELGVIDTDRNDGLVVPVPATAIRIDVFSIAAATDCAISSCCARKR